MNILFIDLFSVLLFTYVMNDFLKTMTHDMLLNILKFTLFLGLNLP